MNCILTNELHIDEWTSPFANGLDQLTNYQKFAPRLEQIFGLSDMTETQRQILYEFQLQEKSIRRNKTVFKTDKSDFSFGLRLSSSYINQNCTPLETRSRRKALGVLAPRK